MKTKTLNLSARASDFSTCYGTQLLRKELDEAISLVPTCLSGCVRAQARFYQIFFRPMLQFCQKYTKGNIEQARDIAQEAFTKVFMNLGTLNTSAALHVWVTKVFFCEIMDFLRQKKTMKHHQHYYFVEIDNEMSMVMNDDEFEYSHDLGVVLFLLTNRYKNIFQMTANGYSYEDISIEYRMPTGTVKSIVCRERARIKKQYSDICCLSF